MNKSDRVRRYQQQSRLADKMAGRGDKDEAIRLLESLCEEAVAAGDEDYRAFFEAESINYSSGDHVAAIRRLEEAIVPALQAGTANAFLLRNLGNYYGHKGDQDAAIEWYDKALAENPKDWNAMREKGVSLGKKGDLDASIEWFDKALKENPKDWNAMRNTGVSLSKKGDEEAAIVCFDKALAENPKDWNAMREKSVSLFNKGDMDAAIELIGKAAKQSPNRWRHDFLAICKMASKDPNEAWRQLVGETPSPPSESQNPFDELRLMINTIRSRLKKQANEYLGMKDTEEKRLLAFLEPQSRLAEDCSLLMVLRKWNSYTPALPSSPDDERSRGGGYFIWHNGYGTVIDPGFNFIENFHQAGGRMCDIHNIILTHAHPDHTAEFETLRTLLFEYNDNIHELNKKRTKQTPELSPKKVRFFLNNGAFRKFAGMLDLRDHEFTDRVITLNRDSEFDLLGGGRLSVLPAYHDELLSRDQAVGLLLTLGTKDEPRRILLTSDTGLFPLRPETRKPTADARPGSEIGEQYLKVVEPGQVDVMLVHIGSIKPDEFDTQKQQITDACYANHLGIIGTARVIAMCRPKLAVVSEFGEEMRDFRFALIKDLRDSVLKWYFQDKDVQSPQVVPGDLAFVYSIMDRTVLDCATRNWSPADEIDFWEEDKTGDDKGIYYAKTIPPTKEKKRDSVQLFHSHRNAHDGMYFAPESS